MKDVKELLELIAGLKELALAGKGLMADGKLNLNDVPAFLELLDKQSILVAAFSGLSEIPDEAKNLSNEEAMQIVAALVNAAKEFKAA